MKEDYSIIVGVVLYIKVTGISCLDSHVVEVDVHQVVQTTCLCIVTISYNTFKMHLVVRPFLLACLFFASIALHLVITTKYHDFFFVNNFFIIFNITSYSYKIPRSNF